jgi:hypothetical protein
MSSPLARQAASSSPHSRRHQDLPSSATAPSPPAVQPQFSPETAAIRLVDAAGNEDGKLMIISTEQHI